MNEELPALSFFPFSCTALPDAKSSTLELGVIAAGFYFRNQSLSVQSSMLPDEVRYSIFQLAVDDIRRLIAIDLFIRVRIPSAVTGMPLLT